MKKVLRQVILANIDIAKQVAELLDVFAVLSRALQQVGEMDLLDDGTQTSLLSSSCVVSDYLVPFATDGDSPFVEYLSIGDDKKLASKVLSRREFFDLALLGASFLRTRSIRPGDCVVHWFTDNRLEDLIFRFASVLNGSVPVTINWQADTLDRALYKARICGCRLALVDAGVSAEAMETLPHTGALCVSAAHALATHVERLPTDDVWASTDVESTRIVIFTSGTTGRPKGVRLPYKAYACNRKTFEDFLDVKGDLECVVTNPMHHTNSTAITDWVMRRPGAKLKLMQRYTTAYWHVVALAAAGLGWDSGADEATLEAKLDIMGNSDRRVVCPLVARHVDFLDGLATEQKLPIQKALFIKACALGRVTLLLGSAPVGPKTVSRLQDHAGCLPVVRFGSTETCLQVCGTPLALSEPRRLEAFKAGWEHVFRENPTCGYYIGRAHEPFTEVRVVKSADPTTSTYLVDCAPGEPGQIVTRGENLMSGYVKTPDESVKEAIDAEGWYTNLGDVGFFLRNQTDGGHDLYWLSRDSALLIRGGANYSYEQINAELTRWTAWKYELDEATFEVAVVGLKLNGSEHEDSCCVTIELKTPEAFEKSAEITNTFVILAKKDVGKTGMMSRAALAKGSVPDRVRVGVIPKNFKGAVLVKDLQKAWKDEIDAS